MLGPAIFLWLTVVIVFRSFGTNATECHNQAVPKYPFQDPSLSWEVRLDDLVNRLTLEEIVAQTLASYGGATPAIPRLGISPYVWISECLHGQVHTNTTAFPQAIGLAAAFRYSVRNYIFRPTD